MKRLSIVFGLCLLAIQATAQIANTNLGFKDVDLATVRNIADFECENMFGDYPEFACIPYYDGDDRPAIYAVVFACTDRFNGEAALDAHLSSATDRLLAAIERIRNAEDAATLDQARADLQQAQEDLTLPDDFVTIFVSATTSRSTIPEEMRGLPEYYSSYERYRREFEIATGTICTQRKFYYFGPGHTFFHGSPNAASAVNVYGATESISVTDIHRSFYRLETTDRSENELERLREQWHFFSEVLTPDNHQEFLNRNSPRRDASARLLNPAPPDYNQDEFVNILPKKLSCVVMANSSALSYYDHPNRGYFNLVDFAVQGDAIAPRGGFTCQKGYPVANNKARLKGGVDDLIYNVAVRVKYNFSSGLTNEGNVESGVQNFANTDNGLSFDLIVDNSNGTTYTAVCTDIDNGNPVTMGTSRYQWDSGNGTRYSSLGRHDVIIIGYNTAMGSGYSQGIYVYLNGITTKRGERSWDYIDLTSKVTWQYRDGGSSGDYLDAPVLTAPEDESTDVEPGAVTFEWEEVTDAAAYWIQVSKRQNFDIWDSIKVNQTVVRTDNAFTLAPGTYYWHVAAKNSANNWCQFSDVQSFTLYGPNLLVTKASVSPKDKLLDSAAVTAKVYFKNNGNEEAGSHRVACYYSINSTWDETDVLLGSSAVTGLDASAIDSASLSLIIPDTALSTTAYIIAVIDDEDDVTEWSSADNVYAMKITLVHPDLKLSLLKATKTSVPPGGTTAINYTVTNAGTGTAKANIVDFYWSENTVKDESDVLLGSQTVSALATTKYKAMTSPTLTLPNPITGNVGYVLVKVDVDGYERETNENNNLAAVRISVARPNLYCASGTISPKQMDTCVASKVNALIINNGTYTSRAFRVGYYLSEDNYWDEEDSLLTSQNDSLGLGIKKTIKQATVNLDTTVFKARGLWFVIVVVDDLDSIPELNESDNIYVIGVFVYPGPIIRQLVEGKELPTETFLTGGYPNPFNTKTSIRFGLPEAADVKLDVMDISGRLMERLVNSRLNAGYHNTAWTANACPTGVYFVRMESDGFKAIRRVVLIK